MAKKPEPKSCNETIHENGFRFTAQRREVFDALMAKRDHPTAVEVFMRVKEKMPSISLATVYNCLETLTECDLVKHVHLDREPSRYCANLEPHGHFFCTECGAVFDVSQRRKGQLEKAWELPEGAMVSHWEVALRGLCPECSKPKKARTISSKQKQKV
jgi:Fur family peroxide stress response transcriptional regulator